MNPYLAGYYPGDIDAARRAVRAHRTADHDRPVADTGDWLRDETSLAGYYGGDLEAVLAGCGCER